MGLFDWTKKSKRPEITTEKREDLKTLGILVGTSDELQTRLARRREFYEKLAILRGEIRGLNGKPLSPEKQIRKILQTIDEIDNLLKECAIPWGRGGSVDWYRQAMSGWEALLAKVKNDVLICYHIIKKKKNLAEKWSILPKLRIYLNAVLIRYAQFIEDASYMAEDITPKYNVVVVTPPTIERPPTTIQWPRPLERDLTSSSYTQEES